MEADKLYQKALAERNEVLQTEVNRLRTEKLSDEPVVKEPSKQEGKESATARSKTNKQYGDGSREKKNDKIINNVKTVQAVKCKPRNQTVMHRGLSAKHSRIAPKPKATKPCSRRSCFCLRPSMANSVSARVTQVPTTSNSDQRTAAARRLSSSLKTSSSQPMTRGYQPGIPTKASSGLQDSTQKASKGNKRKLVDSSNSIGNCKKAENCLLCTSDKRPMVALVQVKRKLLN